MQCDYAVCSFLPIMKFKPTALKDDRCSLNEAAMLQANVFHRTVRKFLEVNRCQKSHHDDQYAALLSLNDK